MKNRYVFVFEYEDAWQIVCYENNRVKKSFSVDEDMWDDADEYVDLFLENGGSQYCYNLPSYDYLDDVDIYDLDNEPVESLSEYLSEFNYEKNNDNKNRYVFVFEYEDAWQIVCYENNRVKKSFSVDEDMRDWADEYVDLFLENGGNQYYYNLPSYDYLDDVNIFYLDDQPIEEFLEYLNGYNKENEIDKRRKK